MNTNPPQVVRHAIGSTTLGLAFVAATDRGLCALFLLDSDDTSAALERLRKMFPTARFEADASLAAEVLPRVEAFWAGDSAGDLPLDLRGSAFQQKVWAALREVPHGTTTTYGALARVMGLAAGSARAIGMACGANPVAVIVPCHRVLAAGGGLGGYHWGIERKRRMLELERAEPALTAR